MFLRLLSSAAPGADAAVSRSDFPLESQDAEVAWLALQHERFLRGWAREGRADIRGRGAEPELRSGIDALWLATGYLEAWRESGQSVPLAAQVIEDQILVPPSRIAGEEDVRTVMERLLDARDRLPERLVLDAATLLAELAQNVCEHSGSIGAAAATWTEAGVDAGLCLAVVDRGIGLAPRVEDREPGSGRRRPARIAGEDGPGRLLVVLTSGEQRDEARGMGLRLCRGLVARHRGAFHLRSGGRVLTVGADPYAFTGRCQRPLAAMPGTQVCVRLRPATRGYVDTARRIAVS